MCVIGFSHGFLTAGRLPTDSARLFICCRAQTSPPQTGCVNLQTLKSNNETFSYRPPYNSVASGAEMIHLNFKSYPSALSSVLRLYIYIKDDILSSKVIKRHLSIWFYTTFQMQYFMKLFSKVDFDQLTERHL